MGNYNFNAAHVPHGQLPGAHQAFHYYLGLCRISFYSRVLRAGCHAGATNAEQLFCNKGKKIVSYILDYVADEDYTYGKTVGYAIDYKLKQVNYFEHNYPEGLVEFVRWLTTVYGVMFLNYMETLSDPMWERGHALACTNASWGDVDGEFWTDDGLRTITMQLTTWSMDEN